MSRRGSTLRRLSLLLEQIMNEEPKCHENPPLTVLNAAARAAAEANREAATEIAGHSNREPTKAEHERRMRMIAYRKAKGASE